MVVHLTEWFDAVSLNVSGVDDNVARRGTEFGRAVGSNSLILVIEHPVSSEPE